MPELHVIDMDFDKEYPEYKMSLKDNYESIGKNVSAALYEDEKLTGSLRFTLDLKFPGMLQGKILRSPYPHARILNIDTSKAKKLPGVKAVITAEDTLKRKYGYPWARDPKSWEYFQPGLEDKYILALDRVRYIGEEVAAVAAVDEDLAEEALDLIRVEYEELPAVFDPEEALKPGAPILHEEFPDNIYWRPKHAGYGDVEKGFAECSHIREDIFDIRGATHAYIEPMGAIATYDASSGSIDLWSTTEVPSWVKMSMWDLFQIPKDKIIVHKLPLGGGFGGKTHCFAYDYCAARLSIAAGKPVRIQLDRDEIFNASWRKMEYKFYVKTGVSREGKILSRKMRVIGNGGAYSGMGILLANTVSFYMHVPFKIENYLAESMRVFTNTPPRIVQRGAGNDTGNYVNNMQLDLIAKDIDMDPVDFRLLNAHKTGDVSGLHWYFPTCGLTECIEKASDSSDWKTKREAPRKEGHILHGIGMGNVVDVAGMGIPPGTFAACRIEFRGDTEEVYMNMPTWEMGQGTGLAGMMIVAEHMGIPFEVSRFHKLKDEGTSVNPLSIGMGNEGTFDLKAAFFAAVDAKERLSKIVAENWGCEPLDLVFSGGVIRKKDGSAEVNFWDAVREAEWQGNTVVGEKGYYSGKLLMDIYNKKPNAGSVAETYATGAYVGEVDVDAETGIVNPKKFWCAYDVGKAINPLAVKNQIIGGTVCGVSYGLTEGIIYDRHGLIMNDSFLKYKMLRADQTPERIEPIIVEVEDPTQVYGLKSAGMGTMHSAPAAIFNAVSHAIGKPLYTMPITPDKVLKALGQVGEGDED